MKSKRYVRRSASLVSVSALLFFTAYLPPAFARELPFAPTPGATDYLSSLQSHVIWSKLPVSIYFVRDEEYTSAREKAARAGFALWEQATAGFVCYKVQENPDHAQITVRFNSDNNDGHTVTSFTSRHIIGARIVIGVESEGECDVRCTAAHEFGHALGLAGHSRDVQDLMYPAHIMGRAWSITRRDLNTLARVYHVDPEIAADWTPQHRE